MFYTWVSGNTYKVTVVLYGDCGPASAAAFATLPTGSPKVCVFNGPTAVTTLSLVIQPPTAGIEITPVCPPEAGMTQCTNPSFAIPGIKKFVYSANYTFPSASAVWRFVFNGNYGSSTAGRAAAITNIASGSTIQLIDTLNNIPGPNNSPTMTTIPTPFFCLNSYDSYNPGAVDADGDNLQFMLVAATNGTGGCTAVGGSVSYTAAFPAWPGQPITPSTPLQCVASSYFFDPATGQINFYPDYLQRSVVVYNIREFRGGVLVGTCQREMTFLVRTCTDLPPSGIYNSATAGLIVDSTHFRLCSGMGAFSIFMNPTDPNPTNNITVVAAGLPSGATFTTINNGTNHPNCTFSWNTTGVPPGSYVFFVTFSDDNCPEPGALTRAFTVTIDPAPLPVTGTYTLCVGATTTLADATPGGTWSSSAPLIATVSSSGVVTGASPGTAIISYNLPFGCVASATVTVNPLSAGPISGPATVCIGGTTTLTNPIAGGTWSVSGSAATISSSGIVLGVSSGTVTVSYTTTGICGTTSATLVVTVSAPPAPPVITGPSMVCEAATITLSGAPTGGTWGSSGAATISPAGVVTGSTPGTATISYTITSSCGDVLSTKIVTINPLPIPGTITGPTSVCAGSTITLTASVPTGTWSAIPASVATVSPTGVVTGIIGGTATISYTLTNSCGSASATAVITVNPLPVAGTITGPSSVCVLSTITLSSSVAGGTWSTPGSSAIISAAGVVTGATTGTALISYAVTNSCGTTYATKTITIDPLPVAGTISGPGVVCQGSTISLSVSASGGSWTAAPASVATIGASGIVSGVGPGTATISYTVTNSCGSVSATTIITVNPLPTVTPITGPSSVCVPLTITMSSTTSGGVWSSSSGTATVSPTGVVTGVSGGTATISYSVTNSCGTVVATKPVTVNLFPDAGVISGPTQVCTGSSITLTSTVGGGTWSGGAPAATVSPTGGVVTGIAAGTATISYMVVNGCGPAYATYIVTVNLTPDSGAIVGPGHVCQGSTITLTETSPGGVWTSSSSNATISPSGVVTGVTPGTATIHYNITIGPCSAHTSTIVTVDVLPYAGVISGPPSLCATTAMLMTESVTGGTWSCTSGASISSGGLLTGLTAGTVTVSYTYTNSCGSDLATLVVTINTMPDSGTISGPNRVCVGSIITLSESSPGGVWSSSNPAVGSIASSGQVTGITAGTTTISYVVSTPFCTARTTKVVTVDPLAVPGTIIAEPYMCAGTIDTITSTVPGGTWSFSGSAATLSSSGIITAISAGTITVTYTVTNICGPKFATRVITINALPNPGTITGPHAVCIGASISLTDVTPFFGTWTSSNPAIASVTGTCEVTSVAAGTATITYTATASTGCSNYATHIVTVVPLPDPGIISGPPAVCSLAHIQLHETVPGGTWGSSNATVASINDSTGEVIANAIGSVIITYTTAPNAGGCINRTTYPLSILSAAPFTINRTITDVHCYGNNDGSISVSASSGTGPWQFSWTNGATSGTVNNLAPGFYSVEVKDLATGCRNSDNYNIKQPDSIVIFPTVTNDVCDMGNGKISVAAAGGTAPYQYNWQDGSIGDNIANLRPGQYTVHVFDAKNCQRQRTIDVLEDECLDIVVHDGVSPNGDGINEYWIIDGITYYRNNVVQLFDKWGDRVYEQKGYDNHFDGRGTNGSPLPDGTYFYVVHLNAENGSGGKNVLTGSILIKR
jgi:gliding motility-associated-like protein